MSTVHIFGLDHFLQNLETNCLTQAGIANEGQQKSHLAAILREIVVGNRIRLVAEEGKPDCPCLGTHLALESGADYVDVTMPLKERGKHGVKTPHYDRHDDTRRDAYRIFEQYMFDRVKSQDAEVVLIMCGRRHLRGLERLFKAAGDDARTYDINQYDWYLGIPQEGAEGVMGYHRED